MYGIHGQTARPTRARQPFNGKRIIIKYRSPIDERHLVGKGRRLMRKTKGRDTNETRVTKPGAILLYLRIITGVRSVSSDVSKWPPIATQTHTHTHIYTGHSLLLYRSYRSSIVCRTPNKSLLYGYLNARDARANAHGCVLKSHTRDTTVRHEPKAGG